MNLISMSGQVVPEGRFSPESSVVGTSREECLAALVGQCLFAYDMGYSVREHDGLEIYTVIGGSIV
jgi:predicted nuclease with RNAse H fold